jgi:hypothetical protein
LLVAEFLAGTLWANDRRDDLARLHEHSELYGWTPRAGSRVLQPRWTTINAKGLRGALVPHERTPGVARIVMVGDSIAFGTHVGDDETFAHLIDVSNEGLEIVNLAVQGYGLDQSLLKLVHEGLLFSPDLVVLNICVDNDLVDIALPVFLYDGSYPKPYYRVEDGELVLRTEHLRRTPADRLAATLSRHSSLYAWLTSRGGRPDTATREEHWTQRRARALLELDRVRRLCVRLLTRMREVAAEHGARLLVAVHPNRASYHDGMAWAYSLASTPALRGTPLLDMRREYLARGLSWDELALDGIGHLSSAGHRAAASIMSERLLSEPVTRSSGPGL